MKAQKPHRAETQVRTAVEKFLGQLTLLGLIDRLGTGVTIVSSPIIRPRLIEIQQTSMDGIESLQDIRASRIVLALWDILTSLDRMGRISLVEYQGLRACLVRMDFRRIHTVVATPEPKAGDIPRTWDFPVR